MVHILCGSIQYSNPFLLISNQTRFDLQVSWTKSHKKWEQVYSSRRTTLEGNSQLQLLNRRKKIFDHAEIIFIIDERVKDWFEMSVTSSFQWKSHQHGKRLPENVQHLKITRKKSPVWAWIHGPPAWFARINFSVYGSLSKGLESNTFTCSPLKVTFLGIIRFSPRLSVFHESSSF